MTRSRGTKAQRASLLILSFSASADVLCTLIALLRNWILVADVLSVLERILEIYSVPFGLVAGVLFAQRTLKAEHFPRIAADVALGAVTIWSSLIAGTFVLFAAEMLSEPGVLSITGAIQGKGAFLVVAALGYLFGQKAPAEH